MKKQSEFLTSKIDNIRAAHSRGDLDMHEVAVAIEAADTDVASSWGPAMRR